MKAYAFYTNPVKDWLELLIRSSEEIKNLEIVPILGEANSTRDLAGATHSHDYMKLMLSRWLNLPDIIRNNIGNNILFLDCDIVFNKYKKDFANNIESFLKDNDLVTQYDTNSGMSLGINMGFLGIKCSEKTLNFFSEFMDIISKIENPNTGYPQIEFNDYLKNYNKKDPIKFKTLPQDYGYLTPNCYFYHAIGLPGHQGKTNAMKLALSSFKETYEVHEKRVSSSGQHLKKETSLCLIVNTISKNRDVWPMFFDQIKKHVPDDFFSKKYVFVDKTQDVLPSDYEIIYYDTALKYRDQFLSGIKHVKEEYCIYISEDYVLYGDIHIDIIKKYQSFLDTHKHLSFIRFSKGGMADFDFPNYTSREDLFELHHSIPYFYTNQAAVWRTRDLEKIHHHGPNLHIANMDYENSFEWNATKTCQKLDIRGLFCYHNELKRGIYHYDSLIFPHVATALVKGRWNLKEYEEELLPLIKKYNINVEERGAF